MSKLDCEVEGGDMKDSVDDMTSKIVHPECFEYVIEMNKIIPKLTYELRSTGDVSLSNSHDMVQSN